VSKVYVCNLATLSEEVARFAPEKVLTLIDPGTALPSLAGYDEGRVLRLFVHDIVEPLDAFSVPPDMDHVAAFLEFGREIGSDGLLVHCFAGISRSTAAAYAIVCQRNPGREEQVARALRTAGPHAYPNRRIVALADEILGREGRMVAAVDAMTPPSGYGYAGPVTLALDLDAPNSTADGELR
jgi:predicted protein tyrosine phosphatase